MALEEQIRLSLAVIGFIGFVPLIWIFASWFWKHFFRIPTDIEQ